MPYVNADLTNSLLPTLEQIRKYVRSATRIDKRWRDVRGLMSVLQRLPVADQYLLGLVETRKLGVLSFTPDIRMAEGIKTSPQEAKRIDEMKKRFHAARIYQLFSSVMNGILFGMSAVRLTWDNVEGLGTMVVRKQNVELTELDYDLDDTDGLMLVSTDTRTQQFTRAPLDPETHIITRYNPLDGIDNNLVGSYMRSTLIYSWIKYYDYWNWARTNEKYADPTVWAQFRKGADDKEIAEVVSGLEKLGTDSRAAFSDDVKLDLLEASLTGSMQSHEKLVEAIRTEQAIMFLGQHLTTEIREKGSFAAAKIQNYVREDRMWGDLILIQNIMSDQYIRRDYEQNYGTPADGYPGLVFASEEVEDKEANMRIVAEAQASEIPLKKTEVYKKIGFTQPEPGDEVFGDPKGSIAPKPSTAE